VDDLAGHGIRQRNVGPYAQSKPDIRPLRGGGAPRVDDVQLGSRMHGLKHMVEEDRVRLAGIGSPKQDHIGVLHLLI
jgi:hypothetical protein